MPFEQLWAAWRHEYVEAATQEERHEAATQAAHHVGGVGCVFCALAGTEEPNQSTGVVWRGDLTFAVLNAYPYASGHLLVLPLRHVGALDELTEDESQALWRTVREAVSATNGAYAPDGLNVGANLGRAAGAGIPRHLHLHVVARWSGDTNFMTTLAGVRVIPDSLDSAWERLTGSWPRGGSPAAPAS